MVTPDVHTPSMPGPALPPPPGVGGASSRSVEVAEVGTAQRLHDTVMATHLRDAERRSARVEDKLAKDMHHLRLELTARLDALEHHVRTEIEAITGRFAQETEDRQVADKQRGDEAHGIKSGLLKEVETLRHAVAKVDRDQRQAVLDCGKKLMTELHRVQDELASELAAEVRALEDAKVGRTALASLLSEGVVRLNGEFSPGGAQVGG